MKIKMTREEALAKIMNSGKGFYNINDFEFFSNDRIFEIAGVKR